MKNSIFVLLVLFVTCLLAIAPVQYSNAQNYNQLKAEDRSADWQPPFPDEEFSFSRFDNHEGFANYIKNRFPIGTSREEVERVLIDIGGANASKTVNPEMKERNQYHIRYSKYTWRNFLMQLMMSSDGASFAGVDYDKNDNVIKRLGNL